MEIKKLQKPLPKIYETVLFDDLYQEIYKLEPFQKKNKLLVFQMTTLFFQKLYGCKYHSFPRVFGEGGKHDPDNTHLNYLYKNISKDVFAKLHTIFLDDLNECEKKPLLLLYANLSKKVKAVVVDVRDIQYSTRSPRVSELLDGIDSGVTSSFQKEK